VRIGESIPASVKRAVAGTILFALVAFEPASDAHGENQTAKLFDDLLRDNVQEFNRMARSGDGRTYYRFSYVLDGTLAQYEGTADTKYLEQVLLWADSMIAAAKIIDDRGTRSWSGPWMSPYGPTPIAYMLDELQGATGLARAARLILTDESLAKQYGDRARRLKNFVRQDVVDKWLDKRASRTWFRENAANPWKLFSDKSALLVRILLDLYRCNETAGYKEFAEELLSNFKRRLVAYRNGALIWDVGRLQALDTSHANRMPYMAVDAYESGVVIQRQDIEGLARLLSGVIWDQSTFSPRFANYIDGSNEDALGRGPWGNGQIYSGWLVLGGYDKEVQRLGEATLTALVRGARNPSLRYMDTVYGRLCLVGHLTRNRSKLTARQKHDTVRSSDAFGRPVGGGGSELR
jgi:hypothetical protein